MNRDEGRRLAGGGTKEGGERVTCSQEKRKKIKVWCVSVRVSGVCLCHKNAAGMGGIGLIKVGSLRDLIGSGRPRDGGSAKLAAEETRSSYASSLRCLAIVQKRVM